MELGKIQIAEVIIAVFFGLLFIAFTITIKKNNENVFFSMRSSNLMIFTNIFIFLSLITYILNDILYEDIDYSFPYFSAFYFIFQLTIFLALIMRYFRLYLSCRNPEDNNVQFNMFTPKNYHYEYFYVRLLAIAIILILGITAAGFFIAKDNGRFIMISHEILLKKTNGVNDGCYYFWIIFSFIETVVFLTFFLLIEKTSLNPNVHISLEIFLVALINYIYSLSMVLSFLKDFDFKYKKNIIEFIPIIYNILIYFVVIALPFLYGVFNTSVIIYDLPGELCSSLYLFLTKEKCFDAFHDFLKTEINQDRDKNVLFLNLLISIFKYRLLVNNNESHDVIMDEINNIRANYLEKIIRLNYVDDDKEKDKILERATVQETINNCLRPFKINLFDKVASGIYQILDEKFNDFKRDIRYTNLQHELEEETNIRCKLANFGLIRN
jgi:hypothetical protein